VEIEYLTKEDTSFGCELEEPPKSKLDLWLGEQMKHGADPNDLEGLTRRRDLALYNRLELAFVFGQHISHCKSLITSKLYQFP